MKAFSAAKETLAGTVPDADSARKGVFSQRLQVFGESPIWAVPGAACRKFLAGTAGPAVDSVDGRKK